MNKKSLRAVIIEWLGAMYDENNQYQGNPDYRSSSDVDELIEKIMSLSG